ncbi:MAG: redoxin family protein [Solirubrobacterales bacterium]|nr:redoxin family protein [Solirubrobacterales bacterium]
MSSMAHRQEEKEARRQERLRHEAEAAHKEARDRRVRRAGYGAVAAIAATLLVLAVVLGGGRSASPGPPEHPATAAGEGPAVGMTAPAFSLTDATSGRQVTAAGLRGRKTLLFFSEGVSCQACLVQAADLERSGALKKAGIDLVSVSTDDADTLGQAAAQYGIRSPMLADPSTEMSSAYGMLGHGGMGHPQTDGHAFMLLDEAGKVRWHQAYQEMYVKTDKLLRDMGKAA